MINITAQTGRKFSNGSTWHSELLVADCNEKTATMEISKTLGPYAHRSNAVGSADVVCI